MRKLIFTTCLLVGCAGDPAGPDEYTWASEGRAFDFDAFEAFGVNLVDPEALSLVVPYVEPGETVRARVSGSPYTERQDPSARCALMLHVTEGSGVEVPVDVGGAVEFPLDVLSGVRADVAGEHRVALPGSVRVRLLGRVSRPDRFCGLSGSIELSAISE